MKLRNYLVVSAAAFGYTVHADWQYRSRPDLSPPRLNITIPATADVEQGYIFVTPYSLARTDDIVRPEQPAAYIFRNNGDLVWSSLGYLSGFVGNFQATRWQGKQVLQAFQGSLTLAHGHGFGHVAILDQQYESVLNVRGGNHKILDIHEFRIVEEKTALVEIYQQTPRDLSAYGGSKDQQWIVDGVVQEINLDTGDVVFEWHTLDHVGPQDSVLSLAESHPSVGRDSFSAWDYFHINSVDKDDQGNYLVSGRHTSAIYKIDGKTGQIIWQLGGEKSSFTISEDLKFAFQHDARFRSRNGNVEVISLFDNGAGSAGQRERDTSQTGDFSSGKFLQLNTSDWSATLIKRLVHPQKILAASQGNLQALDNGNAFINWGQAGSITEYRASDNKAIFNAFLDSGDIGEGVQSYRGFRFNWTGYPNETPAVVAYSSKRTGRFPTAVVEDITIYVSWNGDTETAAWRFYETTKNVESHGVEAKNLLDQVDRESFETSLTISKEIRESSNDSLFFAEAVSSDGKILATTHKVATQVIILPLGGANHFDFEASAHTSQIVF